MAVVSVKGRVSPAPGVDVAPFHGVPTRSEPASWHAVQRVVMSVDAWS